MAGSEITQSRSCVPSGPVKLTAAARAATFSSRVGSSVWPPSYRNHNGSRLALTARVRASLSAFGPRWVRSWGRTTRSE